MADFQRVFENRQRWQPWKKGVVCYLLYSKQSKVIRKPWLTSMAFVASKEITEKGGKILWNMGSNLKLI